MPRISGLRLYKMVCNELRNVNGMNEDNYNEASHFYICEGCGKVLDKRDLGQVFSHGWINVNTGKIECSDVDLDIGYTISKRDGDAVAWTKEKRPVGLK